MELSLLFLFSFFQNYTVGRSLYFTYVSLDKGSESCCFPQQKQLNNMDVYYRERIIFCYSFFQTELVKKSFWENKITQSRLQKCPHVHVNAGKYSRPYVALWFHSLKVEADEPEEQIVLW